MPTADITVILDRSGSMQAIASEAIGIFKEDAASFAPNAAGTASVFSDMTARVADKRRKAARSN